MNRVVFIDTNVPIYATGRDHPYKEPCAQILRLIAEQPRSFVTSSEVLQELLHHYLASNRWNLGRQALRDFTEVMQGRIEPVLPVDVQTAANLADNYSDVNARDLVHVAVMLRFGITRIISADADFDRVEEVQRLNPLMVGEWSDSILDSGAG